MNFYKHYLGDFQRDTGHLSLTERGAYLALMHHYYATETPLPNDHAALCRIAGAFTKAERDAVKAVSDFFELRDGSRWHKRIEAELEKQAGRCDKNRVIALAREERKRAEKQYKDEHEKSTKRADNVQRNVARTEHQKRTIPEPEPEPYISKEETHTHSSPQGRVSDFEKPSPTQAAECAMAMKRGGIGSVSPQHPELLAFVAAGITPAQFEQAAQVAVSKAKGFAYALGVLKGQLREANSLTSEGLAMPEKPWDESRTTIEAEGERLGLGRWDEGRWSVGEGESFADYTKRVQKTRSLEASEV